MKTSDILLGLTMLNVVPAVAQNTSMPNIVFILMDDLGYGDLGCYGQEKIETPHIDALRSQGMRFTQHYSGSPVSAPSRCVLLTGQHSGHAQIRANDELEYRGAVARHDSMYVNPQLEGQYPLKEGTMTLGCMLQGAGYTTGCFGKWGLGYPGSTGEPNKQGFDVFFGYNCQRQAHTYYPAFLWKNGQRVLLDNEVQDPHLTRLDKNASPEDPASFEKFNQKEYANDLIFDELLQFVEDNQRKPFFAMWTTPLPHVSLQAPQKWVDYYVGKFGDEKPYQGERGYMPCRYPRATYAAMISYFDEQVGLLVEDLKRKGIFENTLIVFTSDNGPTFNGGTDSPWFNSAGIFKSEYGWGKCFVHEGGIRVPAIYVWPDRIAAGSETDHVSGFLDVMPTFAEMLELDCPPTDGISFLPTLLGNHSQQKEHPYLYWEYPDPKIGLKAVRMGKWKGILTDIRKGNRKIQLFDLEKDIREQNDVSAEYPDIVRKIQELMEEASTQPENPKFRF